MSDLKLGPSLAFDRGIDRITYARQGDTPSLPQRQDSAPRSMRCWPSPRWTTRCKRISALTCSTAS